METVILPTLYLYSVQMDTSQDSCRALRLDLPNHRQMTLTLANIQHTDVQAEARSLADTFTCLQQLQALVLLGLPSIEDLPHSMGLATSESQNASTLQQVNYGRFFFSFEIHLGCVSRH